MRSTDNDLNNPMSIDTIGLQKTYDAWKFPRVLTISQEFYDALQTKDPYTIYHIEGSNLMYYGDILLSSKDKKVSYVMGPSDKYGEYVIYMWERVNLTDCMVEICRYSNPQLALDSLNRYNKVGSHDKVPNSIYEIINSYIDEEISIHDMIVSIISVFGFRDSPMLQELTSQVIPYGMINHNPFRDIPAIAVEMIKRKAENGSNPLFQYYYEIYNEVLIYDFYKDEKYHKYTGMRDLSTEVCRICNIFKGNLRLN